MTQCSYLTSVPVHLHESQRDNKQTKRILLDDFHGLERQTVAPKTTIASVRPSSRWDSKLHVDAVQRALSLRSER